MAVGISKISFFLPIALFVSGCGDQCASEVVTSVYNSSKSMGAVLEKKNCGATTDYVYELRSLEPNGNAGKLLLRFDSGHRADWAEDDKSILSMSWPDELHFFVKMNVPVRIFDQTNVFSGVSVRYLYKSGTTKI